MLDLNHLRAEFGRYLTENTATRWGLDQALMHVCKLAYEQGQKDGPQRGATDPQGRKMYPLDVPRIGTADALRSALADAAEDIESWGAYASDYFKEKHDLRGCAERYRKIARGEN